MPLAQLPHVAGLAFDIDAMAELATAGGVDDLLHFAFDRELEGAVLPLHDVADEHPGVAEGRRDHEVEAQAGDLNPAMVRSLHAREHGALPAGIAMEAVDGRTDDGVSAEPGDGRRNPGLMAPEGLEHGAVCEHDVEAPIRDHDVGLGHVQGLVDARRRRGLATQSLRAEFQPHLQRLQAQQHGTDLIRPRDVDEAVVLLGGDLAEQGLGAVQASDHVAREPPGRIGGEGRAGGEPAHERAPSDAKGLQPQQTGRETDAEQRQQEQAEGEGEAP